MKKIIKSAFVLAIMALAFTSCEDVPAPFDTNYNEQGETSKVEPAGDGTEASPYNVARALEIIKAGEQTTDMVYLKGVITNIKEIDTNQFGNATFSISDTKNSMTKFLIYRSYGLDGQKFTTGNEIAVGDTVVVQGILINFNGTPETEKGAKIISINGKGDEGSGGEDNPGGAGVTGEEMTFDLIKSGAIGSITLDTGKYGSQNTADESTWYTWKFNNITFKGARICLADGTWGEGLQMQGNASDESKQGFLFNADPFSKDIKSVMVVMSVEKSSAYAPNYSFYVGDSAHPTTTSINAEPTVKEGEGEYKYYTYTFDLSSGSYKHFTIANDKVGAAYIMKINVTLK